jgi:periplasmic divalent cation tolerance protein
MRILFCTCPVDAAGDLARQLVERRLVACVNRISGVVSTYRWEGEVQEDPEDLLVLKTSAERLPALMEALPDLHPYDVPEILAWTISEGHQQYVDWVKQETAA